MIAQAKLYDAFDRPVSAKEIRAYYEGAQRNVVRSYLPGVVQSAKKDINRFTRRELLRISRAIWKNNPLGKAVTERLVTFTVGTGIRPEPSSSNEKWNLRAQAVFDAWAKKPDICSGQSFAKLQEIIFRSMIVDGDIFVLKTYNKSGRSRIQLVEGDQVGSRNTVLNPAKNDDGIIADSDGSPAKYIFQETDSLGVLNETERLADGVVHFANIERAGQGRGVSLAASALTTAIDLHDILGLEKAAVKDTATKSDIISTQSGESDNDLPGHSIRTDTTGESGEAYYKSVFGVEAKVIKNGDSYTPYEPKRPGPAWQGFVDFLAELICLAYNLPPSVVRQLKVGGADTRRDLAILDRVAKVWQLVLVQGFQEIYEYVIEGEIEDGALSDAPPDWRSAEWYGPPAATADAGRVSAQDREDIRTGNMTLQEGCGQYGVSWRKHVHQLAVELSTVISEEIAASLPRGILVNRLYGQQGSPIIPSVAVSAKEYADAYGVGVRAGAITPNEEDETALRKKMDLPETPDAVKKSWEDDGGTRRPITLTSIEQANAETEATTEAAGGAPQSGEDNSGSK
jgi:hypothetical protein